jgi:hypothetical protein
MFLLEDLIKNVLQHFFLINIIKTFFIRKFDKKMFCNVFFQRFNKNVVKTFLLGDLIKKRFATFFYKCCENVFC